MTKHANASRPAAVLVGVHLPDVSDDEFAASLDELGRLVETLGYEVVGKVTQKRNAFSPATLVGEGKLKELAGWTGGPQGEGAPPARKASAVIFDHDLTPNQLKALNQATGAEVLDRSGVIVEIFHRHAKTREARLQVEIARLKYLAPRDMSAAVPSERQSAKGAGETAHELDRRRIRDRIAELTRELNAIHTDQSNRRARRLAEHPVVALVGYTNAGKSSLMRALTGSSVLVADKLFATLDTTVRAMHPELHPRILVSDTVGFIKKLPHDLVASFRSTLDEAADASLLLYVVDASDPTFRSQLEVTRNVLKEIGAEKIASLLVLNKIDRVDLAQKHLLQREFPDAVQLSALNPADVTALQTRIRGFFEREMTEGALLLPYSQQEMVGEIRRQAQVLSEKYDEQGAHFTLRAYPDAWARLRNLIKKVG